MQEDNQNSSNTTNELDEWELKREEQMKVLLECQQKMGFKSCLACEKLIGCEIRNSYVKAVYESMNKGHGGGFEF